MRVYILASILAAVNAAPTGFVDNWNLIDVDVYSLITDDETVGEQGEHFEGDMVLSPVQRLAISKAADSRNGLLGTTKRSPDRTVVYHIQQNDFDADQLQMIENALADIANKSCIKFRKRENNEHSVNIQSSANGCFSNVGLRNQTEDSEDEDGNVTQVLNLSKGCFKHGTIIHEMLHTLGFYHMQSTYDRDDFVKIIWENITPGVEHNFAKYTNDTVTDFGVPYDYNSVMHYPEVAFSKNGSRTIIPLQENVKIGQREGLSDADILKLNKMYCGAHNISQENDKNTNKTPYLYLFISNPVGNSYRQENLHFHP